MILVHSDGNMRIKFDCRQHQMAQISILRIRSGPARGLHNHRRIGFIGRFHDGLNLFIELIRRALDSAEIPARVYNPTHVNRRRALFDEALELAARGSTIDVTSFPVGPGEDALAAEDAVECYLEADLPRERITVSSDGGGCLPVFDGEGRVTSLDVGRPASLMGTLTALLERGRSMADVLPAFTLNVAQLLRLPSKGRLRPGGDADLALAG